MNYIRKGFLIIRPLNLLTVMFFIITMSATAGESFFEEYSESERLVIAGAYLAVGEQYGELGENEKGDAYKRMADEIFPGIENMDYPDSPVEAGPLTTLSPVRPSGKEPAAVQYFFGKLMRAVFSENERDLASLLSTRLYLPGYDDGVEKKEVLTFVRQVFKKYPLDRIDPVSIYSLNRIYIMPEGSSWVASVSLTEEGIRIFDDEFGFYGRLHKFYFREYREGWRLIAVNAE
ncbi:hypothetical protein [Oceanispirochaeta sp.]|jgi:hypothetical protein|uniref:hypothetical protein n=1 Tax=Oceanispirochaeta sp. TaxID=2035350 RepID=UPI00263914E9|nr:hypothetical protein [Oceanispirochaeta sp.]MDA3956308.1 hypothetical protein [Oceanispirochaeta sp.]